MENLIQFLENNLDKFEQFYAEEYYNKKKQHHDFCYFQTTKKYSSHNIDHAYYEVAVNLCRLDKNSTHKYGTMWIDGSYFCCFALRSATINELIVDVQCLINKHEAVS